MSSVVAIMAPVVNTMQMLPQLHKTVTSHSVEGISIYMLVLSVATNILWTLHGIFIGDKALVIAGIISGCINVAIIAEYMRIMAEK